MIVTTLEAATEIVLAIEREIVTVANAPTLTITWITRPPNGTTTAEAALAFTITWNTRDTAIETTDADDTVRFLALALAIETDDAADAPMALPMRRLVATDVVVPAALVTRTARVAPTKTVEVAEADTALPTDRRIPTTEKRL